MNPDAWVVVVIMAGFVLGAAIDGSRDLRRWWRNRTHRRIERRGRILRQL